MEKYCEKCGNKLNENKKCLNCNSINRNNQTNICAIIGFILSLVSICCCGMTSLISFGFSIVGLINSKDNNDTGKGFAIAGTIISSIFIIILIIIYIVGFSTSLIKGFNGYTNHTIY